MDGMIFNIQKFCLHDGPGIRTTVFFKGCPLRCKWCANPESQKSTRQLTLDKNKCTGCGACVAACPQNARTMEEGFPKVNAALCNRCGACLENCLNGAIALEGKIADVEQVLAEVRKDKVFYDRSGGGVTLSGGEVLLQLPFALELIRRCQNRLELFIETERVHPHELVKYAEALGKRDFALTIMPNSVLATTLDRRGLFDEPVKKKKKRRWFWRV